MLRDIVVIDEARCDGCGLCAKACAEGAIEIVNGKARLVAEFLCDGLGACLGHCPQGAIRIEKRESAAFDAAAVAAHPRRAPAPPAACPASRFHSPDAAAPHPGGGCPGSRFSQFGPRTVSPPADPDAEAPARSELTHWPVQLALLSAAAPVLRGCHLLVAADCVPIACADFHRALLRGRAVVIACPKLDDTSPYVDKLADMIRAGAPASITVAHMEVPCCTGILRAVLEARRRSGADVPVTDVVVGIEGDLVHREIPVETRV